MSPIQKFIAGLLISLFLYGCGQKGDLYLPGQENARLDEVALFKSAIS